MTECVICKSKLLLTFFLILCITACSPVDSVHVFDDYQACILLQNTIGKKRAAQVVVMNKIIGIEKETTAYSNHIGINLNEFIKRQINAEKEKCAELKVKWLQVNERAITYLFYCACNNEWKINKVFSGVDAIYKIAFTPANSVRQYNRNYIVQSFLNARLLMSQKP